MCTTSFQTTLYQRVLCKTLNHAEMRPRFLAVFIRHRHFLAVCLPVPGFDSGSAIQKILQPFCKFADVQPVDKRMVRLHGEWQPQPAVPFIELAPVKERRGIVLSACIGMRNVGI